MDNTRITEPQSNVELEPLFELTSDLICFLSPEGRIQRANPSLFSTLALPADLPLPRFLDLVLPADRPSAAVQLEKGSLGVQAKLFQCRMGPVAKESRTIRWSITLAPKSGSLMLIGRDVTDLDKIQTVKDREARLLWQLMDSSSDCVFAKDVHGRYIYVNAPVLKVFGLSKREDLLQKTNFDLLPPPVAEKLAADDRLVMEQGETVARTETVPVEGKPRVFVSSKSPWYDEAGVLRGIIGVAKDITSTKQAERDLRLFASVVETSGDFIGLCTPDLMPFYVNDAGRRMIGLDANHDIEKTSVLDYFWPEDRERIRTEAIPALEKEGRWSGEVRFIQFQTKEPIFTFWNAFAIKDDNGKTIAWATISPNLNKLKQVEAQLRRQTDELHRSNKELEQFAYASSHDLQEPLRKIISAGGILNERYRERLGEDGARFIDIMSRASARMLNLIQDLLAFSRVAGGSVEAEAVDLNQVVSDAVGDLDERIREAEAEITVDPLPTLRTNASQMHQLFINLIGNGLKYRQGPPRIHISTEAHPDSVLLCISDNGIGIDRAYHDKIFEVFQRLHGRDKYAGSGIGLAICKKIVERWGGRIWVESELGRGSRFFVRLPK